MSKPKRDEGKKPPVLLVHQKVSEKKIKKMPCVVKGA